MSSNERDREAVSVGMMLWALTIAFASVCYILASGHDVFDGPFGDSVERRIYPILFFLIIPIFGFLQAALSETFSDGCWRVAAFSVLFSIGFWEEWMTGAVYGVFLLLQYALFRWILDKTNWQFQPLNNGLERLSQNVRLIVLIWITIPVINLIAAVFLHPVLTEMFSSGGGTADSIRLYSIRPSLIRRVDMLSWNGLIIFAVISSVALFMLILRRKG